MKSTDPGPPGRSIAQFTRFVAVGALNTVGTYVIYLALLRIAPYPIAYTLSFAAGIAISLMLNAIWVFRTGVRLRTVIQFPVVYLVQYLVGLMLLATLVEKLALRRDIAPLVVVACTMPVTFFLSRAVFRRPA